MMTTKAKSIAPDICEESSYSSPIQIFSEDAADVHEFFQYYAANSDDSPLSMRMDIELTETQKDELWKRMLKSISADDADFLSDSILRNHIIDIQQLKLSDTTLVCDRNKGFYHVGHVTKGVNKKHKTYWFFKRIRDAFAHGRIAVCDDYLILEDKTNELTGRIVVTKDALKSWMNTINEYREVIKRSVEEEEIV